ncbi:DUF3499 family protein [Nesterenkonia flava]|uniref:DUF3499 family protein n=1 Tax=Nesterenkonia flava TaxID=469799 RepID=A0ABU1FQ58_9MICC|nr:DUF3499 family protein [Nesterenkonia flava]MDR5710785.1 DUF3499 family protein [Nesterenkonia flava]
MDSKRRCTKTSCDRPAAATLTYAYKDSTIVVGPISLYSEPHTYDLCSDHADRVNPPRGWEVLRLDYSGTTPAEGDDDLLALADAVRAPRHTGQPHTYDDSGAAAPHDAGTPGSRRPIVTDPQAEPSTPRAPRTPLEPPAGDPGISRRQLRLIRE